MNTTPMSHHCWCGKANILLLAFGLLVGVACSGKKASSSKAAASEKDGAATSSAATDKPLSAEVAVLSEIDLVPAGSVSEIPGILEFSVGGGTQIRALRDGVGQTYVRPMGGHCIAVFNSDGEFSHFIGRSGQGPGELGRFAIPASLDRLGRLWVWDPELLRASIFLQDGEFVHSILVPFKPMYILGDGSLLGIENVFTPSAIGYPAHLADSNGSLIRSFGRDPPRYRSDQFYLYESIGALQAGSGLWLTSVGRYDLQLWDPSDGRMIRELRPKVEWFKESIGPDEDFMTNRPTDVITGLLPDAGNILWVLVRTSDADWKPFPRASKYEHAPIPRTLIADFFDWVLQALDASTGRLMAERRFRSQIWLSTESRAVLEVVQVDRGGIATIRFWTPVLNKGGVVQ